MRNKRYYFRDIIIFLMILVIALVGCNAKKNDVTNDQENISNNATKENNDKETIEPIQETHDGIVISREIGNTRCNLYNGGIFAQKDDWIIYSLKQKQETYKIKKDGTEKTILINHYVTNINVVGDWVYYLLADKSILEENLYKT